MKPKLKCANARHANCCINSCLFCPHCGHEYPKREAVKHVAGTLSELVSSGNKREISERIWPQIVQYVTERREPCEVANKQALAIYKSITGQFPTWGMTIFNTEPAPVQPEVRKRIQSRNIRRAKAREKQKAVA